MKVRFFRSKNLLQYLFILTLLSLGGYLAYAQFTSDAYVIRTINVFPASIEAPGWKNADTLTFQNLGTYALTQEFNSINSAYLDPEWKQPEIEPQADRQAERDDGIPDSFPKTATEQNQIPPLGDGATTSSFIGDTSPEVIPMSDQATRTLTGTETELESDVQPEAPVDLDGQEADVPPTPQVDELGTPDESLLTPSDIEVMDPDITVSKRSDVVFRLAAEVLTTFFSDTIADDTAVTTTTPAVSPDVVLVTEEVEDPSPNDYEPKSTDENTMVDSGISTTTENETPTLSETTLLENESTTTPITSTAPITTESIEQPNSPAVLEPLPAESVERVPVCTEDCDTYTLVARDFGFPLDAEVDISGAQLRLSLAAQKKTVRDAIPMITIDYSVDGGMTFVDAGAVIVEDEESNGVNGGYYLFALSEVIDQRTLDELEIRISYSGDANDFVIFYIDSFW